MSARQPAARGNPRVARQRWRVAEDLREQAAPEFAYCEAFSERVPFDRAALTLAASVEEVWVLRGSDDALEQLIMQEQTVLEGPHSDVLAGAREAGFDRNHPGDRSWPLLAASGELASAPYWALTVLPAGYDVQATPIGTLCVARDSATPFTPGDLGQLAEFATLLAGQLLSRWQSTRDVDRLAGLVHDQRHVAAGVLASSLGVLPDQALAIMRARAFQENRTLAALAEEVMHVLGSDSDP